MHRVQRCGLIISMRVRCADGRRMFPAIQVQISGMDRCARYALAMDVVPVNEFRYRYHGSRWTIAGAAAAAAAGGDVTIRRIYVHPDSPMTGQQWMSRAVSFIRLKLTNNLRDSRGYVSSGHRLTSLHILLGYWWTVGSCNLDTGAFSTGLIVACQR